MLVLCIECCFFKYFLLVYGCLYGVIFFLCFWKWDNFLLFVVGICIFLYEDNLDRVLLMNVRFFVLLIILVYVGEVLVIGVGWFCFVVV